MPKTFGLFVSLLLCVLSAPNAGAHVEIISSFPQQYSNVNPIPDQVWIEFSGNLQSLNEQAINSIEVIDSSGLAVNVDDSIIQAGKISTRISGQSAPGVFTVRYRVVGEDGHVIEGEYTFNASPDYSLDQSPMPITSVTKEQKAPVVAIVLVLFLLLGVIGFFAKLKRNGKL